MRLYIERLPHRTGEMERFVRVIHLIYIFNYLSLYMSLLIWICNKIIIMYNIIRSSFINLYTIIACAMCCCTTVCFCIIIIINSVEAVLTKSAFHFPYILLLFIIIVERSSWYIVGIVVFLILYRHTNIYIYIREYVCTTEKKLFQYRFFVFTYITILSKQLYHMNPTFLINTNKNYENIYTLKIFQMLYVTVNV